MSAKKATIYDIQRFSLHDGPGIRTTIFFKGCPLRCNWCANPESQESEIELFGDTYVGSTISAKELLEIAKRDKPFFKRSGGGITLSGGEPLLQYETALELIRLAQQEGINVAIETSGYQDWDKAEEIFREVDYIYYDIKVLDAKKHFELTGVTNEIILDNLAKAVKVNKNIVVRIPIIPNVNDSFEEIRDIALFVQENGISEIELMPYHRFGIHKYEKLNREYELMDSSPIDKEQINCLVNKIKEEIKINIY